MEQKSAKSGDPKFRDMIEVLCGQCTELSHSLARSLLLAYRRILFLSNNPKERSATISNHMILAPNYTECKCISI